MFESETDKKDLAKHLRDRKIISTLAAKRVSKGLSQADIAEKMGCNQPKISKMESGADDALTVSELEAYAKAIGLDVTILVSDRGKGLAEQIKFHAFSIRNAFLKLVELAHQDNLIVRGVASFHLEAFQNINRFLAETADKLPVEGNGLPYVQIVTADDSEESHTAVKQPPKKRIVRRPKKSSEHAST